VVASWQADAIVDSGDGVLTFTLSRCSEGVHVHRSHRRSGAKKLEASLIIASEEDFARWLELDLQRFEYPIVFDQLRRSFHELVQSQPQFGALHA
jgi:hypothetical protein